MVWENDCLVIRIDEMTVPFPSRVKGEIRLYPTIYSDYHAHLDPRASIIGAQLPLWPALKQNLKTKSAMAWNRLSRYELGKRTLRR